MSGFLNRKNLGEVVRFGIVGVVATLLHYGIYLILSKWINLTIAYTIGYALSFIANFYLSNRFTFRTKASLKKGFGFGLSHALNYFLQIILLQLFIYLGVKAEYAPFPVYAIVIPINFLLVRFVLKR